MKWAKRQNGVETLADWLAPAVLAASAGWAAFKLGLPILWVVSLALAAFAGGLFIMFKLGSNPVAMAMPFDAPDFEPVAPEWEELLLEAKDELLILDDPLVEPETESRVVQLFVRQEPTPGELVDRISDFLAGGSRYVAEVPSSVDNHTVPDASVALHAALANIRASLR